MRISLRHVLTTGLFCVLTFAATYFARSPALVEPTFPSGTSATSSTGAKFEREVVTPAPALPTDECKALHVEIERLQSELARLQAEMSELEKAAVQGFLTSMAKRIDDNEAAAIGAQEATADTARRASLRSGEMFGGFSDMLLLLHDLSRMGDAGVEGLIAYLQDPIVSPQDRESAINMLTYLPTKASLDFLMQPHAELDYAGFTELSDDGILPFLERLPTGDVAAYIPEIREYIDQSLESGSSSRGILAPLVALALIHDDAESRRMLRGLQGNDAQVTAAIISASSLGTPEATRFVEEIATTHPSADVRNRAQELLGGE
ncbi:MAG: hypothetical protein JNK74_01770 [Candidatus Hydrogenedentes bacterium]|nr:hypothetical protein [Candidatus Hydrogenedentota bacterium]